MRADTKMDANRLIAEVYKRPALWNQRHISYHNRDETNRVWMEIATLLKLPKQLLKTKWKGLRDTFRAEMKKEQACKRTKYPRNRPEWVHFKSLQFLKDQMSPRPRIWERASCPAGGGAAADSNNDASHESSGGDDGGNNKPATLARTVLRRRLNKNGRIVAAADTTRLNRRVRLSARTSVIDHRETSGDNVMTSVTVLKNDVTADTLAEADNSTKDDRGQPNVTSFSSVKLEPSEHCEVDTSETSVVGGSGGQRENSTAALPAIGIIGGETSLQTTERRFVETDNNESARGNNNRYDDDYYFFLSLLPHIRSLSAERRMLLRMQMQQLVYQEVYKESSFQQRIVTITGDSARIRSLRDTTA